MIKLRDLISASYSNIIIMDSCEEVINFRPHSIEKLKIFNPDILEREVSTIDANNNTIRIWFND